MTHTHAVRIHMEDASSSPTLGPKVRRVAFTLLDPLNVTPKLFVVQREAMDNQSGYQIVYRTVATASDIDNLSEDAPPPGAPWTPYRVNAITLTADVPENPADPDDIDRFITMLQRRLKSLFIALARFEQPDVRDITVSV